MAELKSKSSRPIFTISMDAAGEADDRGRRHTCEKEYEPHLIGGNTEYALDYWSSIVHLMRSTVGTGILILPFAFKQVGWTVGLVGSIFTGIVYVNTVHALLFTEYELCKRLRVRNLTFVALVHETFALCSKRVCKLRGVFKLLMYFYYGVPTGNSIYLIIIATNVKAVLDHVYGTSLSLQQTIVIVVVPVTLLCLIPRLKLLVPLSILTNVFTLVNVIVILFYSTNNVPEVGDDVKPVEDVNKIPQFFSMMLQSLYVTGIILPLKNTMSEPKDFSRPFGVMNVSFAMVIALYTTFGLIGYLNYGCQVRENILSNLPTGHFITLTVYVLYSSALCVTYTLVFFVYSDTIWTNVLHSRVSDTGYESLAACVLRVALSILAFVMAVAIPDFALLTTIVGTIGILLEISLPAILQIILLLTSHTYGMSTVCKHVVKDSIVLILAASMFVMSCKHCYQEVVKLYS